MRTAPPYQCESSGCQRLLLPVLLALLACWPTFSAALAKTSPNPSFKADQSDRTSPDGDITIGTPPKDAVNLIRNGDFEKPSDNGEGPAHWQGIDNLVWTWTTDPDAPDRGKVLKIDTDVYQKQAYDWWIKRFAWPDRSAPLNQAPAKTPTSGPKYDTIGGLDGGFYWSDYIPVKEGGAYKVYIDSKGPRAMVFIRGYVKELPLSFADESPAVQELFRKARNEPLVDKNNRPVRYRLRYLYSTWFTVGGTDQWQTYTHRMPRHPNNREITENVRFIRIMIYPFWPAGTYWYDNVKVIQVPPADNQGKPKADQDDLEEVKVVK